ncbi:hypothetical protein F444_14370 [Phytophthora nicotianae P1976]|nr:hypothetical protein F444_14370 [Phytophthora nicotianae P1976]
MQQKEGKYRAVWKQNDFLVVLGSLTARQSRYYKSPLWMANVSLTENTDDMEKCLFFSPGEYLLTDSAYPADFTYNTIVPAYKVSSLGSEKENFNKWVAHVRVVNEQTIGVLKGRWSSLRELRVQIRKSEDMNRELLWLSACVVLHIMVLLFGDDWPNDDESSDSDSDGEESDSGDEDPYTFRRRIKAKAIARGRAPGGILRSRS